MPGRIAGEKKEKDFDMVFSPYAFQNVENGGLQNLSLARFKLLFDLL